MYLDGDARSRPGAAPGSRTTWARRGAWARTTTPCRACRWCCSADGQLGMPDFVSFYRWHVPDPIVFRSRCRVTIQQIGAVSVPRGHGDIRERIDREGRVAGSGWYAMPAAGPLEAFAVCERQDDYCATASSTAATAARAAPRPRRRRPPTRAHAYETPSPYEAALSMLNALELPQRLRSTRRRSRRAARPSRPCRRRRAGARRPRSGARATTRVDTPRARRCARSSSRSRLAPGRSST